MPTLNINNASFEAADVANGVQAEDVLPGWTIDTSKRSGTYDPTSGAVNGATVDGQNVAYIDENDVAISQTLSHVYDSDDTYEFSVDLGIESGDNDSEYTLNIYAGTTIIGTVSGIVTSDGALSTVTVNSTVNDPSLNGFPLKFEIVKTNGDLLLIDNVQANNNVIGVVDGTAGDDLIDGAYTDDENDSETSGNDTIDAGAGDDTVVAQGGNDVIDAGAGNDSVNAGAGNDSIFGGEAAQPEYPTTAPIVDWSQLSGTVGSGTLDAGTVEVDYDFSQLGSIVESGAINTNGVSGAGPNSAISIDNAGTGTVSFSEPVSNLTFRVNDFEAGIENLRIVAYDENDNPITYTVSTGADIISSDTDAVAGDDTFTSTGGSSSSDTDPASSILVTIPGPVASVDFIYTETSDYTLTLTDMAFTDPGVTLETGNDTLFGEEGDDYIEGGDGNDSLDGGIGNDTLLGDFNNIFEVPDDGLLQNPADGPDPLANTATVSTADSDAGKLDHNVIFPGNSGPQDVTLVDDQSTSEPLIEYAFPGSNGFDDFLRVDLSTFDDDFTLTVKSERGGGGGEQDKILIYDALESTNNPDGTVTVTFLGSDGILHTATIEGGVAEIIEFGDESLFDPSNYDDTIDGGDGDDLIDGGLGDDVLNGDAGSDTFAASAGSDTIDGGADGDTYDASGTLFPDPDPNFGLGIADPATEPGALASTATAETSDEGSGNNLKFDAKDYFGNDNTRQDVTITDDQTSDIDEIKYRFYDVSNDKSDYVRLDLASFEEDFQFIVSGGADDGSGVAQDTVIITGATRFTDNGDGTQDVDYIGSDGETYTVTVNTAGAALEVYGIDPGPFTSPIESIDVTVGTEGVDGPAADYGDGSVIKTFDNGSPDQTDTVEDVESFIAGENPAETDSITLTNAVRPEDVLGISSTAVGTFTLTNGGGVISFGGSGEPTITDILNGPLNDAVGDWEITSGDESGTIGGIAFENFETISFQTVCFVRGTRIETIEGYRKIEDITEGCMVRTMDHGFQPVRWIHSTKVAGKGRDAPILIREGTLGNERDILVSQQHRMLLQGWQLELLFEMHEALVPAKMLVNDSTILQVEQAEVEYFHMMFDTHEIVYAEGAPSESFHPGHLGMGAFSEATREEVFRLFPALETDMASYGASARPTLLAHEASIIVNGSDLLCKGRATLEAPERLQALAS